MITNKQDLKMGNDKKNDIKSLLFHFIDFPFSMTFFIHFTSNITYFFLQGDENDKNTTLSKLLIIVNM